jgi:hypothetical protein
LQSNEWRGNIRELENCIERAVILAEDDTIEARHLLLAPGGLTVQAAQTRAVTLGGSSLSGNAAANGSADNGSSAPKASTPASSEPLPTMREAMRVLAQQALSRTEGDESAAATMLDIGVEELQSVLHSEGDASANGDGSKAATPEKATAKRAAASAANRLATQFEVNESSHRGVISSNERDLYCTGERFLASSEGHRGASEMGHRPVEPSATLMLADGSICRRSIPPHRGRVEADRNTQNTSRSHSGYECGTDHNCNFVKCLLS